MAGIEDLTNIMMAGGRPDVPMPQPQGGGGTPMLPPSTPPMPPTMAEQAPMPPAGGMPPQEAPMPEEGGMSIEQDSMALAEAVVGRAQGDIATAVAILDTAKQLLISSAESAPVPAKDGRYLYRENGGTISDADVLRQMIMENLQKPEIQEQGLAEAAAKLHGQTGRAVSDKDIEFYKTMLREQADYERHQTRLEDLRAQGAEKLTGGVPTSGLPEDEIKARNKAMSDVMKFKML